jgi:hypothetical protein
VEAAGVELDRPSKTGRFRDFPRKFFRPKLTESLKTLGAGTNQVQLSRKRFFVVVRAISFLLICTQSSRRQWRARNSRTHSGQAGLRHVSSGILNQQVRDISPAGT